MAITTALVVSAAIAAGFPCSPTRSGRTKAGPTGQRSYWPAGSTVEAFLANWAIRVDTLSVVMMFVVTSVSALVHIYSIGYMEEDPHRARFFSYLSLFTFAMLMLVTSDNFIQLFLAGKASYFLLSAHWLLVQEASANSAAIKAFVVNRVGDLGFALG
jgi:NADH-quinone oxidoreductase subunit L